MLLLLLLFCIAVSHTLPESSFFGQHIIADNMQLSSTNLTYSLPLLS